MVVWDLPSEFRYSAMFPFCDKSFPFLYQNDQEWDFRTIDISHSYVSEAEQWR